MKPAASVRRILIKNEFVVVCLMAVILTIESLKPFDGTISRTRDVDNIDDVYCRGPSCNFY